MKIIYNDGSTLDCSTIEIGGNHLYIDDIYVIHIDDVESIEDDEA